MPAAQGGAAPAFTANTGSHQSNGAYNHDNKDVILPEAVQASMHLKAEIRQPKSKKAISNAGFNNIDQVKQLRDTVTALAEPEPFVDKEGNQYATASLLAGLAQVLCPFTEEPVVAFLILTPLSFICGIIALRKHAPRRGSAIAGIILSGLVLLAAAALGVYLLLLNYYGW